MKSPLGTDHSAVDGVLAVKDVYPLLLPHMKIAEQRPMDLAFQAESVSAGDAAAEKPVV